MFYRDERLALFIDGSNLDAATKALGFDIDYKLLRSEFMRRGKMVRAFYYTALIENEEYSPIRPLVDWLDYNGFTLVTKPAKEFTDSDLGDRPSQIKDDRWEQLFRAVYGTSIPESRRPAWAEPTKLGRRWYVSRFPSLREKAKSSTPGFLSELNIYLDENSLATR